MRNAFVDALIGLAGRDDRIFLLTADLGWSVLERFAERFPRRFVNVGVAEQNMIGIATGLAQVGFVPFAYSIATFASMRAYEQVRNGPLLHGLPVRIVGIGGGYAYGHAGPTHHALEDLCIFRSQPAMTVIAPADPAQAAAAVAASAEVPGPVYLRIGKGGNPELPGLGGRFAFGRPELVADGGDVLLIATGAIAHAACEAARRLAAEGVSAAVAVQAHLPFAPSDALRELLARFRAVVSVEEGYAAGGLGSLVCECLASAGLPCRVAVRAVHRPARGASGGTGYMTRLVGIDADGIAAAARELLGR